ncbi:NAD(P)/FAD-dependent oxidoreductase [Paenibacillus sp. GD4]|uniref:NAD(P)/FAD-dependent oxidoreductase n=1 Tax=Paenibacillus sp. GD4 TaxID=3068890 RepID=UPI00279688F3|nr:NAD(P)/FAD-dependent oxidoreductase [Paenibacillus sp. GD4]MDQ1909079.1 NAD(P)/FAD-dependent oxidoreductase [Paenibacillus sp. GD4]
MRGSSYDVVVVGSRVAGSSLAYELSKEGYEVLLVDRSTFPSDTLSTHNMFNNTVTMLREMGVLDRLLKTNTPTYRRARVEFGPSVIDGVIPEIDGESRCLCIRRTYLDHILLEHAKSQPGVTGIEGFRVTDLVTEGDEVRGIIGRHRDGRPETFRAKLVVGCDGRLSAIRQLAASERKLAIPTDFASYVGYVAGYKQEGERHVEFYKWDDKLFIAFPTSDDLFVVGVMFPLTSQAWLDRFKSDAELSFRQIVAEGFPHTSLPARLSEVRFVEQIKGLHGYDNDWYQGMGRGWALLGDALTFKDPAVGQGIHDAIYGSRTLTRILTQTGRENWSTSWDVMSQAYQAEMETKLMSRFHMGCQLTKNVPVSAEEAAVNRLIGSDVEATRTFLGLYNYTREPADLEREIGRLLSGMSQV